MPTLLIVFAVLALAAVMAARLTMHDHPPHRQVQVAAPNVVQATPWADDDAIPTFPVIRLRDAMGIAARRFEGRIIAAELVAPTPIEAARGVQLVYALRLLSTARDVLTIRLDARDGAFLEAAGHGLAQARRRQDKHDPDRKKRN